jgi:hypothetical protein
MAKNDKYACFQWIREVRGKMNEDTEGMTPEERVAYNRAGAEKALAAMPKLSLVEARRQRQAILHPETTPTRTRKSRAVTNVSRQRKAAKRLVHA